MAGTTTITQRLLLTTGLIIALTGCGATTPQQTQPGATQAPAVASPTTAQQAVDEVVVTETPHVQELTEIVDGSFYWLDEAPEGTRLNLQRSGASERGFTLVFDDPMNASKTIFVEGDAIRDLPLEYDDTVVVRSVEGFVDRHEQGNGQSIFWEEQGWLYYVGSSGLSRDQLLDIAETLQPVDRADWEQRLQAEE